MADRGDITRLLAEAHDGRAEALDEVMHLVYEELSRIAQKQIARRRLANHREVSLEPAELVSEAYLKLVKQRNRYDSRGHFFAIATRVMLRVLMDHHRARGRVKRGGDQVRMSLSQVERELPRGDGERFEIPVFIEALERLESLAPRTAEVAKLRLVWGLDMPEIADALSLSVRTAEREWRFARQWLGSELTRP